MAINTAVKRFAAITVMVPGLPVRPDGSLNNSQDRADMVGAYAGAGGFPNPAPSIVNAALTVAPLGTIGFGGGNLVHVIRTLTPT